MVDGEYACTATLANGRLFVVLHALKGVSSKYQIVNHAGTVELDFSTLVVHTPEIGSFACVNVASPFKGPHILKTLEQSAIVMIYGYGAGSSEPEAILAFGSPKGWANAKTEVGTCTSPVLDVDGRIVGFWTHGNGKFGCFDPITPEFIASVKATHSKPLSSTVFQSGPLSQEHC